MTRLAYGTRVRQAIVAFMRRERRYVRVAEIHAAVGVTNSTTALSTIYRSLDVLESFGEVSRQDRKDGTLFVYCGESVHHHATCRCCGAVEEIEFEVTERVALLLAQRSGFELEPAVIEFVGRCYACRRTATGP